MGELDNLVKLYGAKKVIFEEENFLAYRPGGFHPVTLGDTLKDGRYKMQHKIGLGRLLHSKAC
jgi:serine/threonine-protein kinase SRPK3